LHWQPAGRYHIHELVRQYAGERLAQSPTAAESAADRHCAWYTSALQQWMADLKGPRQQDVLAEMDAEIENAHAAWDWAVEHTLISQLHPAIDGLCTYYQRRGRLEEGQTLCRSVVEMLPSSAYAGKMATSPPPAQLEAWPDASESQRLLAKALTWHALFVRLTGYAALAEPVLEQSIVLLDALASRNQDVRAERAFALLEMGRQAFDLDRARAERCLERSLELYQALDDRWGTADTLYTLGWLADGLGSYDRARHLLDESLAIRQAVGDRQGTVHSLVLLGLIALRVGQLEQGESLLRQSIAQLREMGERVGLADGLHYLGFAAFLQGRFEHGIALQEECLAIATDLALGHPRGMALQALGTYHAMLGRYEQARAYATTGLAHARLLDDAYVIGATCVVLGLISLAQEDYVHTQRWLEQGLAAYQEMGQQDAQSWSLAYLGYAAQGLGDLIQARHYLYQALQMGIETDAFLPIVVALSGSALLMARIGDAERAVELWALLSHYPLISNAPLLQDTAGRYIAAATAALSPEATVMAKERGLTHDLYAAATQILAWLDT
ncbi:MAG: tetratricopeptide repeat protein, partial [Anaerolineae bacterium]